MIYTPQDGYPYYLSLAQDEDIASLFENKETARLIHNLTDEQALYRYAADKWNIKEVIGHITDHERIKMYRAFLLSRETQVELWGYDQEWLVSHSRFEALNIKVLLKDYEGEREASIGFIRTLSARQLTIRGKAKQYEVTLETFLRTIIGHERHHLNILKDRYGLIS